MLNRSVIFFRVKTLTELSQVVKVCGNVPELGSWNPHNAITLCTEESVYPTWLNTS